jgi:hypothetical protein
VDSPEARFFGYFLVALDKKVTCRAGAEARYEIFTRKRQNLMV